VFGDFVCRELVDVMKQHGITRCFYGHIHGKYNIPDKCAFEGIDMTIVSADYLNFIPLLVR
jgi:predicted phosphohydrolase